MATVALTSTSDPVVAVRVALGLWEPSFQGIERITLVPRFGRDPAPGDDAATAEALCAEIVSQLRHATAAPIEMLVQSTRDLPRGWPRLAERVGVRVIAFDQLEDADFGPADGGSRVPLALDRGSFSIELTSIASLLPDAFEGLSLLHPDRFMRREAGETEGQHPLRRWRPDLVVLDALTATVPGTSRTAGVLAVADDRRVLDAVAVGLYRLRSGSGPLRDSPIARLPVLAEAAEAVGDPSALEVRFLTDGDGAADIAKRLTAEFQKVLG